MPAASDDRRRRFLIAVGASRYDGSDFSALPAAEADLSRVKALFTTYGYQHVLLEIALNASAPAIREAVTTFASSPDRTPDDVIAFYFSGHGDVVSGGRHYLWPAGAKKNNPGGTAIATEDLATWFFEGPRDRAESILLLLDACYVGEGAGQALAALAPLRQRLTGEHGGVVVLSAARPRDEADEGAFSEALEDVLGGEAFGDRNQRYIDPVAIVPGLNRWLEERGRQQRVEPYRAGGTGEPVFFPNPNFKEGWGGENLEVARWLQGDRQAHWEPRSRGVELVTESGRFFTGRRQALTKLVSWLQAPQSDRRIRLVTGDPGSGKSTVLARLVTLAFAGWGDEARKTLLPGDPAPNPGDVDVPIHARKRGLAEVAKRLGELTGGGDQLAGGPFQGGQEEGPRLAAAVLDHLSHDAKPLRIVIDALDEATEPEEIARKLLRPLGELPRVRLIVGSRSPRRPDAIGRRLESLGEAQEAVDLDDKEYFEAADVAAYVGRRLMEIEDSPYVTDPATATVIAEAVAKRAKKSFLVAALVSRGLARAKKSIDTAQDGWTERLPSNLADAFEEDLERFGSDGQKVRDLLTPLAYAQGRGIPQETLWAEVASKIAGVKYSNSDIQWLKREAGFYITPDVEAGVSVYRLYHEALAEHLRRGLDAHRVHGCIVDVLQSLAPVQAHQGRWDLARPYYLEHLAYHLVAAERRAELRELLLNYRWLAARLEATNLYGLLADFDLLDLKADATLRLVRDALVSSGHVLAEHPRELAAQLRGRLLWTDAHEIVSMLEIAYQDGPRPGMYPLWPLARPGPLRCVLVGHGGPVNAVAVTPDGKTAVAGEGDGTLRVWDLERGEARGPLEGHTGGIRLRSVAITPNGKTVVAGWADGTLMAWDLVRREVRATLEGHAGWVGGVAVAPDGKTAALAWADGTLSAWDLDLGEVRATLEGHAGWAGGVAVTPDGRTSVTGSDDGTLKVWELGQVRATLEGHTGEVWALAVTPDGKTAVAGSTDGTIRVWDLERRKVRTTLEGHSQEVRAVAVTPDGKTAVSGSTDGTLRVWDLEPGVARTALERHADGVRLGSVAATPDGKTAVSGSADGTIKVWDLERREVRATLEGYVGWVLVVAVTPDGKTAVTGSADGTLKVWDLDLEQVRATLEGHAGGVTALAVTPDGKTAVTGSADGTLKVWDLDLEQVRATLEGHAGGVTALAVTPDGKTAVARSADGTLEVWDLDLEQVRATLEGYADWRGPRPAAVTPDGKTVVSVSTDRTLKVWDLERGEVRATLEESAGWILALAVTPDGKTAVLARADGTLRVWDLVRGEVRATFEGHLDGVLALAVTPDGKTAVAGLLGGTLNVLDLERGEVRASYHGDPAFVDLSVATGVVIAEDRLGRVYLLALEN